MELQALLVLGGLAVAGAAVLLLMGLFSASGTSYEEAMAQQRRATTELLALAEQKNKPKKNVKKANKKLAKKDRKESVVSSEVESEAPADSGPDEETPRPHVEFSPPVVVEVPRDSAPAIKIRKRGKDVKVKPILVNKEDPSCVLSEPPSPGSASNHFEETHPKDEFELMHVHGEVRVSEKKEEVIEKSTKPKQAKGKPAGKQAEPKEDETKPTVEAPKDQRKGKKDKRNAIDELDSREEVVAPLSLPQPSELTTEKLLKQALAAAAPAPPPAAAAPAGPTPPPGGKGKKKKQETNVLALMAGDAGGVNVTELVGLVRGAALSRAEIQLLTDTLLNKHHDPLPQHSEWIEGPNDPMQKLKKQLADKEKALADETEASQALHAKLRELRALVNAERARAATAARAGDEAAARAQRLHDDKMALTQDLHVMQAKLANEAEAQAQRVQMEIHIQRLSESESALLSQLAALQAEAGARAAELSAAAAAHAHAGELALQLQEANRVCAELDLARQNAMLGEQALQHELAQAQERLKAIPELQTEMQRQAARAQQAEAALAKQKDDADKQTQQLSSELSSLKQTLSAREAELAEVKQLKVAPAQNGLPNDHKSTELARVEAVIVSLRAELEAARRGSAEQRDQVRRLQDQLQGHQDKNNELRTKNWKVMEALQSCERTLQSRAAPAEGALRDALTKAEQAHYAEVATLLKAACPKAAPTIAPSRGWLEQFAAGLRQQLERPAPSPAASPAPSPADARVRELSAQNEHLQGLVDRYKKIIDDTEGVLSRLQQNVTSEEQNWARQLADTRRELEETRQRTAQQMQRKIDALEEELRLARAKHNHTFADSERFTEEKLLSDLSGKLKETCNGPSQVEAAEK